MLTPLETPLVTDCHLDIEPLTTAKWMHLLHRIHFSVFKQKLDGKNAGSVSCAWDGLVEGLSRNKLSLFIVSSRAISATDIIFFTIADSSKVMYTFNHNSIGYVSLFFSNSSSINPLQLLPFLPRQSISRIQQNCQIFLYFKGKTVQN